MDNQIELFKEQEITTQDIQSLIVKLPNRPSAMLASALAEIYGTETRRINEAVDRNKDRFPEDFYFQATDEEKRFLMSQSAISKKAQTANPYLFTFKGINVLTIVLTRHTENVIRLLEYINSQETIIVIPSSKEYIFGRKIIYNLFSEYKILEQYPVFDGKYRIDWYIPELKLAVEFDELHHKWQEKTDNLRQIAIEKELDCRFIRYTNEL